MNKNAKKVMSVVLAAGLAAGCAGTALASEGGNTELKLTRTLFFGDVSDYAEIKEAWPKMIEEKFGYPVTVTSLARNDYLSKVNLNITSGEAEGLVGMFTMSDIVMLKEQGAIEPLDDYLKDNEVWNNLPDEMRNMFEIDGQIWAIPGGYQECMFTRTMRKDWLDNLGLEVPTNLDELYEVCRAFTFDDPDGNGVDDTYGITSSGTWNLQDIFQAFGARLDKEGSGSIVYDVNENAFIDTMLKPPSKIFVTTIIGITAERNAR